MTSTVLLDVDGTLVDSSYHHAIAWNRALTRGGVSVAMADIHRVIGMGADHLVQQLAPGRDEPFATGWHDAFEPLLDEIVATRGARPSEGDSSKPAPDTFRLAMQRVDADPRRTIVVGDSVWDIRAVDACGIGCIGVTCGGISTDELMSAGALAV